MQDNEVLMKNEQNSFEIDTYSYTKVDALNKSSFFSKLFYLWAFQTVKLSSYTTLKNHHLGELEGENKVQDFCLKFTDLWENHDYKSIKKHALFKTLIRSNQALFLEIIIFITIATLLELSDVFLLRKFIQLYENPSRNLIDEVELAFTLIFVKIIGNIVQKRVKFLETYLGDRPLIQLNHLILKKVLKESPSNSKNKFSQGELINLISSDAEKVKAVFEVFSTTIFIPVKVLIYIIVLFKFLGFAFFYGLVVLIIIMGINYKLQAIRKKIEVDTNKVKDRRMKITTELLNNLRFAKMFSWESEFTKRISVERTKEIELMWKRSFIRIFATTLFNSCPTLVSLASIAAYYFFDGKIMLSNIFLLINIFSYLQKPLNTLPIIIVFVNDLLIGLERIQKYLNQEEVDPTKIIEGNNHSDVAVKIVNGNFSWGTKIGDKNKGEDQNKGILSNSLSTKKLTLKNINLSLKKGELLMIIGEVGSGKSSLIQSILNNLNIIENENQDTEIQVNGSLSYVSQSAWIRNNTLRDNITFFNEFDQYKYETVINKCELLHDIKILPGGDLTEIGEKGINLSGGQKARISIARAIYSESDIYLFDDPISALDAHVGEKIMKNCILDHLNGKTRILVTHAIQYLNYADKIIVMKNGEIQWEGKFNELNNQDFYKDYIKSLTKKEKNENKNEIQEFHHDKSKTKVDRITTNEEEEEAKNINCYVKYFTYFGGKKFVILTVTAYLILQLSYSSSDIWLTFWSKWQDTKDYPYLTVFTFLNLISVIFICLSLILVAKGGSNSSEIIHKNIITSQINAPINTYHDLIPKGRIMNRLSKDLREIDLNLPWSLVMIPVHFFKICASIIICSIFVYHSMIFFPIFIYLGIKLSRFYTKASNELTLIERINRSPIINIFTETVSGAITIRAFKSEDKFINLYLSKLEDLYKVNIFKNGIAQWYSLVLGGINISFFVVLVSFIMIFSSTLNLNAQNIALILNSTILLQISISEFLEKVTTIESNMVSVDRCLKCVDIPSEAEFELNKDHFLGEWPSQGKIVFENYSVRYRQNTPLVLKNLTFTINQFEKIGVVGRTGCGKSTLCLSLFRILEKEFGSISIDDVDISTLGLKKLRSNITIIPQDPMLFEGTLRYNIDPLNEYSDQEILEALKEVALSPLIENDKGLYMIVHENGVNISVGERQLISICRAILKKSKIVILDEATANIDFKTEELIQSAIRKHFKWSTLITIAHRIQTIVDYDRILVLKDGIVAEFDTPQYLITNKNSEFYQLYSKSV